MSGESRLDFDPLMPPSSKNANERHLGNNQSRLFLTRLNGIQEKLDREMEEIRISRSEAREKAPRDGKKVLRDEYER